MVTLGRMGLLTTGLATIKAATLLQGIPRTTKENP